LAASSAVSKRGKVIPVGISGWATARASSNQLAVFRKNPGLPSDKTFSPGSLKNSDDQTVLALATICQAIVSMHRSTASYQDWGVVAAANLFGRSGTFQGLLNFRKEGAWGVSPHIIPHHGLHAVSGTISQALQIHGPNFGIGGGPKAAAEAFLVAATLLSDNTLPGLWVVLSGHEPECLPNMEKVGNLPASTCLAAALALESPDGASATSSLLISGGDDAPANWPEFNLPDFMLSLEYKNLSCRWKLSGGGWFVRCQTGMEERQ